MSAAAMTAVGNKLTPPFVSATVDAAEDIAVEQIIAGTAGSSFANTGKEVLVVRNSGATDHTLTFATQSPDNMGTLVNPVVGTKVITLPDSVSAVIGPFDPAVFGTTVVVISSDASEVLGYVVEIVPVDQTITAYA